MTAQAPSFSNDLMYNKKTTWSYDTDVHIMRVVYLAVMHERGQRECITAKYSTSMISSVSYDPGFLFISRFSH